jgi:hypothetical protein
MHLSSRPPLARLAAMNRAIRTKTWPNATTLGRQLKVAPRTIQRDIEFLRDSLRGRSSSMPFATAIATPTRTISCLSFG